MAEKLSNGSRRKRSRTTANPSPSSSIDLDLDLSSFDRTLFPQILAASLNLENTHARSLTKRFLHSLISSPVNNSPSFLFPQSLLSLLPLLLTTKYPSVACLGLEVIGAASLCSIESNTMIASDKVVVKGLVSALGSKSRRLATSACNALMDLATSHIGRESLRNSFALETTLSLFCQVGTIPDGSISFLSVQRRDGSFSESKNDKFLASLLDAATILITTSTEDFSDRIPEELFKQLLPLLKPLFHKIQWSTLPRDCSWDLSLLRSTKYDLASVMFRLSMNKSLFLSWGPSDVRSSLFGTEFEFVNFVVNSWEESPLLLSDTPKNSEKNAAIFSSLIHSFDPTTIITIFNSVLQPLVSCPPITSDELDICSFLDEIKGVLGSPIVYGQDIRVLKTPKLASQGDVNTETHFFNNNLISIFIDEGGIQKCKKAFQDGYTLALRGMEFRSSRIAAVADDLAILFGQPSVGANIYLTPPGSQGLFQHFDDHCVFVWQLFGQKQWKISSSSATLLPRLYESFGGLPGLKDGLCGGKQYLLNEGDILYIPRGFIHEACTMTDESESQGDASTKFSLHLTLGIEVEAPFMWEGFAHIALHCWNETQKQAYTNIIDPRLRMERVEFVLLLHVAIRLIADENPTFRKACMVAACPLSSETLLLNHRAIFQSIIVEIDAGSSFMQAFKYMKIVVQESNDDTLQWMRWLRHLPQEGDENEKIDFNNLLEVFEDLVLSYTNHIAEAMEKFSYFKSKFCRDAIFEDTCNCFLLLYDKYRKTRRQYMNGMLSLHSS